MGIFMLRKEWKMNTKHEILMRICIEIGCGGANNDCPGNSTCEILRKIFANVRDYDQNE